MKANMGTIDRAIRVLIAVVVVALYYGNVISGVVAIVLLAFAGVFLLTSLISFCPLYKPFGISTRNRETKA